MPKKKKRKKNTRRDDESAISSNKEPGGGEGKDDICDQGLYIQTMGSRSVPKRKKKNKTLEEMMNRRSATIRSTSSTKQHKIICQLRTNTRLLLLDRQAATATESGSTTTKHAPSYCLLTTTFEWRSLTTGGTSIIQPSRPRGRSH